MRLPLLPALDRAVAGSARALALIGGLVLLWLMFLTVAAAVTRKGFDAPILGVHDLTEISLLVLVFFGMAHCGRTGGHISVDLIVGIGWKRFLRAVETVVRLTGGAIMMFIAWHTVDRALEAAAQNEATNLLFFPKYPLFIVVAAGFALYAVVLVLQGIRAARGADNVDQ